jgi:transcriptional regulator with XRE-family HTH domain
MGQQILEQTLDIQEMDGMDVETDDTEVVVPPRPRRKIKFRGTSGNIRPMRKLFGERVMKLRKKRGKTQEEMGERFGLTKTAWGNFERGSTSMTLDRAWEIADYFGVPICDLVGNDPNIVSTGQGEFDQLRGTWELLDESRRKLVIDFAEMIKGQQPIMETPPKV